jgi:copper chaperone CopZ
VTSTQPKHATLFLSVPGLIERPAVGTSCCASTAEAIVAQELSMLPGITDVAVDTLGGHVSVSYDAGAVDVESIRAALGDIGYPADAG